MTDNDELSHLDEVIPNPPHWLFDVVCDNEVKARVYAPKEKRNWTLWRLSKYVLEFESQGVITVRRYINGKWENADEWRNLSH